LPRSRERCTSPGVPSTFGKPRDRLLQRLLQCGGIPPAFAISDAASRPPAQEAREQVLRLDLLVVLPDREALRLGERLLQLRGEFFVPHPVDPERLVQSRMGADPGLFKYSGRPPVRAD
jgi:hypothetical protein